MKDYNGRKLSIGDQVIFPYLPVDGGFLALKQGTITKEHKEGFMEVSFAQATMSNAAKKNDTRVVYVADVIKAR
ncbi:hypothetical protein [Microscilla marina]|uniref:Uncharacterized protein n=1 Tax=Microscilla marina ATCC 23134 TaxID=313606 RepID=A1ZRC8_MICM2|nr:hypothetical protein [Microscilla marina]EAY27018.1 hypothetical protein M23134_04706 [Microscilla marina ATCC 23134]